MKFSSLFGDPLLLLAISCLVGCGKKAQTDSSPALGLEAKASNAVASVPISQASRAPETNAAAPSTGPLDLAKVSATNPPVMPKPVYPAQETYERGISLIKTNESNAVAEQAIKLFQEAAEKGNPPAEHALGLSYLAGVGVKKNVEEGLSWLRKSADAGYADAQFKLASLYARGGIVPVDEGRAAELARKAAEQGHAEAEYNLGTLYSVGKGVPKDEKQAALWFKKAAEAGQPAAQSNMGVLYANGGVFEKSMDEAIKWWKKAAEQGQPSAQFNLGQALTEGKAVPKDLVEAYKWYYLAAQQGDPQAAQFRDAVAMDLDPTQLAEALKRARLFKNDLLAKWQAKQDKIF